MVKYSFIFLLLCLVLALQGQEYFQQDVNYDIKVKLVDSIHTLEGEIKINYKNNSPNDLSELFFHLWGNAFKNRSTAFAQQKVRNFNTKFYYADEEEYGFYSDLDFKVDGNIVNWKLTKDHIDIAVLTLSEPLKSGASIVITTPFSLRIPNSFSRLGHVESSYQLTQWFPKPAVYDREGWHAMPYLDMGEFYSEFGDFDVEITLPENYFVGATGELLTTAETERIRKRISYTDEYLKDTLSLHLAFPESSSTYKTIRYKAENVHDFAWFADKRFLIQADTAILDSGQEIACYAFFTDFEKDLWASGAFYVKRAVEFYSSRVGNYPYSQATAIQSALSAGAGMEYPMVTVIGPSSTAPALDQVITHEVGHNWFYGVLASNERSYPWMDEGMNSYHDHKYTETYYSDFDQTGGALPARIKRQLEFSTLSYVYQIWARLGKDQAPNTHSDELTTVNYFLGAYEKPAMAFKFLEMYLGEDEFVAAMKDYYTRWKFKHPQPADTKASFESSTGKDLSWLFEGMLFSNDVYDYKIKSLSVGGGAMTVVNKGTVPAPLNITYISPQRDSVSKWEEGFLGSKEIQLPIEDPSLIEIDRERLSLDIHPANNDAKGDGTAILGRPRLRFLTGLRTSDQNKMFFLPTIGYNTSNLLQLGLGFHNYGVPLSNFQYYINPVLGSRKGEFIGSFEFRRDFPRRQGRLRNVSLALGGKSYHETYNDRFDYNLRFARLVPSIDFEWKERLVSPVSHFLTYRPIGIITESPIFDDLVGEVELSSKDQNLAIIHDLAYRYVRRSPIAPLEIRANAEYRSYTRGENYNRYLKLYASADAKYAYKENKFFELRGFAGFFPIHSEKSISTSAALGNYSLFHRGFNDYRYDHHFFDRNGQEGSLSRQVTRSDGGFKNGLTNSMPIGLSNNYLLSINLAIDLPFPWTNLLPIKPYFDAGVYSYKPTTVEPFRQEALYSAGLMLDFKRTIMIYFPIFSSDRINDVYAQTAETYLQRVSFTIDLNQLDPHRLKYWFYR